jgi:Mce-associated membrane protein
MTSVTEIGPDTDAAEPAETDGGAAASRRGVLAAFLAVVVLALVVTVGWLGWGAVQRSRDDAARSDAVRAARQTAQDFVSISGATIDRDLTRVTSDATGDFADEFEKGKAEIKGVVVSNKVVSKGEVLEAAVVSSDRDSAVVLVVVDATVVNLKAPKGQLRHYRIRMDVVQDKGAWKVSTLKFVG